ncbi:MAG: toll/interleukin-1 receptor domain-containing protein, partial [Hyphomonadaceae bacterium]
MSGTGLFVSHASEDAARVARIVGYLESQGVPCWISSRDIPPQSIYAQAITEGVKNARACAVILSASTNTSSAVLRELELASRFNRPFIPILIDAVEPGPGLDYYLNNTQWIDYNRDGERALDRIVAHLGARAGAGGATRPPPPPVYPAYEAKSGSKSRLPLFLLIAGLVIAAIIGVALISGGGGGGTTQIGSTSGSVIET